jgi:hypothetical protein
LSSSRLHTPVEVVAASWRGCSSFGTLIDHATDILARAEVRAGEMLIETRVNGERDPGGRGRRIGYHGDIQLPTLADIGVTPVQSSRWQKLAALPPDEQEEIIARKKRLAIASVQPVSFAIEPRRNQRVAPVGVETPDQSGGSRLTPIFRRRAVAHWRAHQAQRAQHGRGRCAMYRAKA